MKQQYQDLENAYKNLGMKIPITLATVQKKLSTAQKQAIKDGTGRLIITPKIYDGFSFYDLVDAFDKKQEMKTWIYKNLWDQYDLSQPAQFTVVDLTTDNKYDEQGLQLTDRTDEQQRSQDGGRSITPVDYIIWQAISRLKGKLLDRETWTRFVGLEMKSVDGISYVPYAHSNDVGQLLLYESNVDAYPDDGVRLSVGANLNPQPSTLSSSLTSERESITDYLFDKGHTINKKLIADIEKYYAS